MVCNDNDLWLPIEVREVLNSRRQQMVCEDSDATNEQLVLFFDHMSLVESHAPDSSCFVDPLASHSGTRNSQEQATAAAWPSQTTNLDWHVEDSIFPLTVLAECCTSLCFSQFFL